MFVAKLKTERSASSFILSSLWALTTHCLRFSLVLSLAHHSLVFPFSHTLSLLSQLPPPPSSSVPSHLCCPSSALTSDIQLALHFILAQFIDSHAGVFASVEAARLPNVESQHSLVVLHNELGILTNDHSVLHPYNLWLRCREVIESFKKMKLTLN